MPNTVLVDASTGNAVVLVAQIQGPSGGGGGGGAPSGTGLYYVVGSVMNAAAITLTGDVSQGALSGSSVPLTVTGLQGKALPALSVGYLNYSGTAWQLLASIPPAAITAGVTGQILLSDSGISPTAWTTVSQDASVALSGAWTNSGLGAGTILITANAGTAQWWNGATPLLSQATTSGATGANFTIAPQVSTATNGTPGNFVVQLGAPTGSGAQPFFEVTQVGASPAQLMQVGFGSGVTAGCVNLWITDGATPSGSNPALFTFGGKTYINNTSQIQMAISGTGYHSFSSVSASLNSLTQSASGTGVVLLGAASTNPTAITSPALTLYYDNTTNNGLLAIGPSSGLMLESIVPLWAGTQNSQAGLIRKFGQFLRTTNATVTTAITIPLPTSSTSCMVIVHGVGRNVTALASSAQCIMSNVLNTAGTLTISSTTVFTAGTTAISVTTSGTNILVQVTGTVADNVDWTIEATAIYS